jgi:hypothetical protein
MKWTQWINALIGVWFIISPWTLGYSQYAGAVWLSIILGAILFIVSFWAAVQSETPGFASWQSWVALVMGILFIIESFSWSLSSGAMWTNIILGAVVIVLDLIAMGVAQSKRS